MKIISVYCNKGGVGKTSASVNLSYLASQSGYKTLIIDLDPQSSATFYFRVKPKLNKKARLLDNRKELGKSIKGTDFENLDLLPGDFTHRELDNIFNDLKKPEERIKRLIKFFQPEYDLLLFDCPPTINRLAESVFELSDMVLVPIIPTILSVRSHEHLLKFLDDGGYKKKNFYTFFSMIDKRKTLHNEIIETIPKKFRLISEGIPYSAYVEKMGIYRQPVIEFARSSEPAKAYIQLWENVSSKLFK